MRLHAYVIRRSIATTKRRSQADGFGVSIYTSTYLQANSLRVNSVGPLLSYIPQACIITVGSSAADSRILMLRVSRCCKSSKWLRLQKR